MRTMYYKDKIEELGFHMIMSADVIVVKNKSRQTVMLIPDNKHFAINNTFEAFYKLNIETKTKLMELTTRLMATQPDER